MISPILLLLIWKKNLLTKLCPIFVYLGPICGFDYVTSCIPRAWFPHDCCIPWSTIILHYFNLCTKYFSFPFFKSQFKEDRSLWKKTSELILLYLAENIRKNFSWKSGHWHTCCILYEFMDLHKTESFYLVYLHTRDFRKLTETIGTNFFHTFIVILFFSCVIHRTSFEGFLVARTHPTISSIKYIFFNYLFMCLIHWFREVIDTYLVPRCNFVRGIPHCIIQKFWSRFWWWWW